MEKMKWIELTDDDWTKGRDHSHRLIIVDEARFTVSIVDVQRAIDEL